MTSGRNSLHICGPGNLSGLDACALQSHSECHPEECEVREHSDTHSQITREQIRVGVATAISGLVVSSAFALGILAVWIYHSIHNLTMPDIPWIVTSIAAAPFTAGVITTLRIPKTAKVQISIEPEGK